MSPAELRSDISGELVHLGVVVAELSSLRTELAERDPTLREKVAAAGFLSQFYNGIENILKRVSIHYGVPLPEGESWHVELFERFHAGSATFDEVRLPRLFGDELAHELSKYRAFRHVVRMAYGVELRWDLMRDGIDRVENVFDNFRREILKFVAKMPTG